MVMSRVFVEDTEMTAIADAIREATMSTDKYLPSEMSGVILGCRNGAMSKFGLSNEVTSTNITTCDYVNENEHNVEVKLSSDTVTDFSGVEVKACGQNILQYPFRGGMSNVFTDNGDGSVTVDLPTAIAANQYCWLTGYYEEEMLCLPAGTYTFSDNGLVSATHLTNRYSLAKLNNDGTYTPLGHLGTYAFNEPTKIRWALQVAANNVVNKTTFYPMITVNKYVDNFEPYTEKTYTANADGTVDGITSISPIMNLICDTEGVDISAKYYCANDVKYHRYWDEYQTFGARTNYDCAFAGFGWTDETFNPKYDLVKISNAYMCFRGSKVTDFKGRVFDLTSCNDAAYLFLNLLVKTLDIVGKESLRLDTCFQGMSKLETLNYTGEIGKTAVRLQWSPNLNVESAKNIIRSLINYKGTTYDMTYPISFHANVWALLDAEGNASPNGNTWKEYIDDLGWGFS